jgi:hypothetical protein
MARWDTPTISELRNEARSLHYLLRSYLHDREVMSADAPHRLLYFVDAHELKSYIDPNSRDNLVGFVLRAEQAMFPGGSDPAFELGIKLKSEQLLCALLFDPGRQVGLLPSHAEEVDEEIAFREHAWMRETISLLDQARDEVRRLRDTVVTKQLLALAASDPGNATRKRAVVDFFRQAAPALMALLRPNADNSLSRMKALIETSNLVRLDDLAWEEFGYDEATCRQLTEVRPKRAEVEHWRHYLGDRKERRKNSTRANRIDAEAIAFVQTLNATLAALPRHRVSTRLVTRAMTLINAASDREAVHRSGLREAGFLRHSRLLALDGSCPAAGAKGSPRKDWNIAGGQPERALIVALQTYQRQLKALGRDAIRRNDAEMKVTVETLVRAWDEFETARLTIDLRKQSAADPSPSDEAIGDVEFQKLMDWFRNDSDVLQLLSDEVLKAIQQFGQATFALSQAGYREPILAQIIPLSNPSRSRVVPMISGSPGPVDLLAPGLREARRRHSHLEALLADLKTNSAERYIAWALLFACQRRWDMARIYANSAAQVAQLLQGKEADWSTREAGLLRAQILRLGANSEPDDEGRAKDARRRFESSESALAPFAKGSDPRLQRERAAQILELRLSIPTDDMTYVKLASGFDLLHTALRLTGGDNLLKSRILDLGITYHLAARDRPGLWPERSDADLAAAREWHRQLHAILEDQRRTLLPEEISRRARAVELIGFQMLSEPSKEVADAMSLDPVLQPLRIPAHLRLDVRDLRDQIGRSTDATARLIVGELELIDRRLESYRVRDLIYAPVWAAYDVERILQLITKDDVRTIASAAYADLVAIAGASQQIGVHTDHRGALLRIAADLQRALKLLAAATHAGDESGWRAGFYLRMDSCYARLLLTRLTPETGRQHELATLAQDYMRIAEEYPSASIPHFRLDTILSELDRPDEATREIVRAVELVDSDPFLPTREHWVRSTIQRRIAMRFGRVAARQKEELRATHGDEELRRRYVDNLLKGFRKVHVGFSAPEDPDRDYLYKLEARRRINNIAYYASCILEEDPGSADLHDLGFGPNELRDLLGRLHADGIERVVELNIIHTIGCGYAVLGEIQQAVKAGRRLVGLMAERGDDPKDQDVAAMLADAFAWFRKGGVPHVHAGRAEPRIGAMS